MKKILTLVFCIFVFCFNTSAKETTYNKVDFEKALSEGKIVVVSSWIKYCTSCASQMKVLNKAESDFENMNPTVIRWTFAIALVAPLVFFVLKLIHQ